VIEREASKARRGYGGNPPGVLAVAIRCGMASHQRGKRLKKKVEGNKVSGAGAASPGLREDFVRNFSGQRERKDSRKSSTHRMKSRDTESSKQLVGGDCGNVDRGRLQKRQASTFGRWKKRGRHIGGTRFQDVWDKPQQK